jgi:ferredoxin
MRTPPTTWPSVSRGVHAAGVQPSSKILALFRNPHYLGPNMAFEKRGEPLHPRPHRRCLRALGQTSDVARPAGILPAVEPDPRPGEPRRSPWKVRKPTINSDADPGGKMPPSMAGRTRRSPTRPERRFPEYTDLTATDGNTPRFNNSPTMSNVFNWQLGREMEYPYEAAYPDQQFAFVFNINRCIGCQTCTMACKSTWTFSKGQEYMWWNNVETKPYGGYPHIGT